MRIPAARWLIALSLLTNSTTRAAQEPIKQPEAPQNDRKHPDPGEFEEVVVTTESCRRAAEYSARHRGISMLVMRDGQIIFEDYPGLGSPRRAHELASGTKSFCGALAAAAVADGLLDLDEPVAGTITEWEKDRRKSRITVRQLLSLTSGLRFDPPALGRVPTYEDAIQAPSAQEPGTTFRYGATPFQIFGELIRRKLDAAGLDQGDPLAYLKRRVFEPIGLEYGRWRRGPDGHPHLPSGAALTARDWAKFGELIRLGGLWEGTRILPSDVLDECFVGTAANPAYGLTWWLGRPVPPALRATIPILRFGTDDITGEPVIPGDVVFAAGAGKQRLYVIRSKRLVVVRQATGIVEALTTGDRGGFSDLEFLRLLLTP